MPLTRPTYPVNNIQTLQDLTKNQATAVKALHDKTGADTKTFLIALLTELESTAGAENIGIPETIAGSGTNVKARAEWLKAQIDAMVLGQIPDGTLTDAKLSNEAGQLKSVVSEHLADYVKQPADGGTTGGTATAYTCSSAPALTALVDRIGVVITVHADSGANPTLNWDTKGAKPIVKPNGNAAVLKAGGIYTLRYNATSGNFILQGEGASGNATASDLLSGKTASTDAGDITGTMPEQGSPTITPTTTDQAITPGHYSGGTVKAGYAVGATITPGRAGAYVATKTATMVASYTPTYLRISENGKYIVAWSSSYLMLFDTVAQTQLYVKAVTISPDGENACVTNDGVVYLVPANDYKVYKYDISGNVVATSSAFSNVTAGVSISPEVDGVYVIFNGGASSPMKKLDPNTFSVLATATSITNSHIFPVIDSDYVFVVDQGTALRKLRKSDLVQTASSTSNSTYTKYFCSPSYNKKYVVTPCVNSNIYTQLLDYVTLAVVTNTVQLSGLTANYHEAVFPNGDVIAFNSSSPGLLRIPILANNGTLVTVLNDVFSYTSDITSNGDIATFSGTNIYKYEIRQTIAA